MKILIADIETDGLLPDLTKCHCLAIKEKNKDARIELYADVEGYNPISEGLRRLRGADILVMHNGIGFDRPALFRIYGRDAFGKAPIYDTLVSSRFFHQSKRSHSLAALGQELGFEKGDHSDWSTFSPAMGDYCKRDG